jgi:hypothetical protein
MHKEEIEDKENMDYERTSKVKIDDENTDMLYEMNGADLLLDPNFNQIQNDYVDSLHFKINQNIKN